MEYRALAGLLGRDHVIDLLPRGFSRCREVLEALGVRRRLGGGFAYLRLAAPLFLGLLPLLRPGLCRLQQFLDRPTWAGVTGRSCGIRAEAPSPSA
jgi:hypothetical protein